MSISVIIIDDDKDTVEVFKEFLEMKGFDVLATGNNGKQAVELYNQYRPDVVLLDVMMPEYDGFYGLRNIHQINSDAKVVIVTADLTEETEKRVKELHASGILYKPYEIDDLVKTIKTVHELPNDDQLVMST